MVGVLSMQKKTSHPRGDRARRHRRGRLRCPRPLPGRRPRGDRARGRGGRRSGHPGDRGDGRAAGRPDLPRRARDGDGVQHRHRQAPGRGAARQGGLSRGARGQEGDLLAQIDPRPFLAKLHQAEAALARDRALLRGHKQALDRFLALQKDGLATQTQVDDAKAAADQDTATLQADQALIEAARLDVDYARITAPADGVTGVRLIDAGNVVRAGDTTGLVVIAEVDPIAVLFTLPQDDLPQIAAAMAEGKIHVEARSRDGEKKLAEGELALVDNQINAATATIRLKATFTNHDKALWPNQFVKARLLLTTRKGAKVVPASVVQRGPQGRSPT